MSYNANPAAKSWNDVLGLLNEVFAKWGVKKYSWTCPASDTTATGRGRNHWSLVWQQPHVGQVTVTFEHPKTGERSVTVSKFNYPADNLWAIWKGLDDIRLNELRGLDDVAREFYAALPAPAKGRDPFEVLGVRSDAPLPVVEAAYRELAKSAHPDKGGTAERMKELNAAFEAVKGR